MVASIMAYSLSGSSANVFKELSQTPLFAHRENRVNVLPIAEALGQIAPRRPRAELPNHPLDKKPIAQCAIASDMPRTARQQMLNSHKLVVPQPIASHRKPPNKKAPSESRFTQFANPPIEDTP